MNPKITEYMLLGRPQDKLKDFISVINEALSKGWQPLGTSYVDTAQNMFQAMVKYEVDQTTCQHEFVGMKGSTTSCYKCGKLAPPEAPPLRNVPPWPGV
jgi:hypothetical protein